MIQEEEERAVVGHGGAILDTFKTVRSGTVMPAYPASEVPYAVPHLAGPGHI